MPNSPTKRKHVKVKSKKSDAKFGGIKYICVRCKKEFSAKRSSKYCSDPCRVKGPHLKANTGGRKAHHGPITLANEIQEYFEIVDKDQITPAGLLLFLGITREMWSVYEQKPQLKKICAWAQLKMEHLGTQRLYKNGRVADIFFMKNMGWSDKQEIDKKEHLVISDTINDEQTQNILERFASKQRKLEGEAGGDSSDSKGSK